MFTQEEKRILEEVNKHIEAIESLYNQLNRNTQEFILDQHNSNYSLPHCIRWGMQATEELLRIETAFEPGTIFIVKEDIEFNDGIVPTGTTATLTQIDHAYLLDDCSEPFHFYFDDFQAFKEEDAVDGYSEDLDFKAIQKHMSKK